MMAAGEMKPGWFPNFAVCSICNRDVMSGYVCQDCGALTCQNCPHHACLRCSMKTEIVGEPRIDDKYIVIRVSVGDQTIPVQTRRCGVLVRSYPATGAAGNAAVEAAKTWLRQNNAKAESWYDQLEEARRKKKEAVCAHFAAVGFDVEDDHVVVTVSVDAGPSGTKEVVRIGMVAPGVFRIVPSSSLPEEMAELAENEADTYYAACQGEMDEAFEALQRERLAADAIYEAAKQCRATMVVVTLGIAAPKDAVARVNAARVSLMDAVEAARKIIERHPVVGEALEELNELGDRTHGRVFDFTKYAELGEPEGHPLWESARRARDDVEKLLVSYEVAYVTR
jgi:hypothetical protein